MYNIYNTNNMTNVKEIDHDKNETESEQHVITRDILYNSCIQLCNDFNNSADSKIFVLYEVALIYVF